MATGRLDVKVAGKREAERALEKIKEALRPDNLRKSVAKGADVFVEVERDVAPERSGQLKNSVKKEEATDDPVGWIIAPHTIYARIQDQGGTNYPKRKYFKLGEDVYIRKVEIEPKHYVDRAFEEGKEPAARAVIADIISKIR